MKTGDERITRADWCAGVLLLSLGGGWVLLASVRVVTALGAVRSVQVAAIIVAAVCSLSMLRDGWRLWRLRGGGT